VKTVYQKNQLVVRTKINVLFAAI